MDYLNHKETFKRIDKERKRLGISKEELCKQALNNKGLSSYAHGLKYLSVEELKTLCKLFGCEPNYLLTTSENKGAVTGLSKEAEKVLQELSLSQEKVRLKAPKYSDNTLDFINAIIESFNIYDSEIDNLIHSLGSLLGISNTTNLMLSSAYEKLVFETSLLTRRISKKESENIFYEILEEQYINEKNCSGSEARKHIEELKQQDLFNQLTGSFENVEYRVNALLHSLEKIITEYSKRYVSELQTGEVENE